MEKVYIFGHRKPDTDAVCGTIALSYLKNKMGLNTEPRILSEINTETKFALNKFKIDTPKYLNDVKIQLSDVKYKKNYFINETESIYETYNYMSKREISGIPIVNENKLFVGYVSLKEIAKELIISSSNYINTSFDNLIETLNASKYYKFDEVITGNIITVTMPYRMFINNISLDENSILIVGERQHILDYALKSKVKLLILIKNNSLTQDEIALAKKNKVNVIITPYESFKVSRIICLANPISSIKRSTDTVTFDPNDYLSDFLEASNKLKHTNYPIVSKKGICYGMLRVIDTNEYNTKKVILVDHNEPSQSAEGLNEAEVLEIVDHHNIGDINTHIPINFRNMAVGSVNTIIYTLFIEQNIKIPANIAGIMLSGLISDTLLLASPTTTELDKTVAKILAKKANIDLKNFGFELLSSGVSIKDLSTNDVIYKDFKNYTVGEHRMGIAQTFTTNFNEYLDNIDSYIENINNIAKNNNYIVVCLFVTDIITNDSYILFNEGAKKYIEDAFNINNLKQGELLKGIVSRKKQVIPLLMSVIEKI